MWFSKTPLRVSFLGGGTDYPSYFNENPGAVLGGTINKYVYIQALPLAKFAEQRYRITYRTTESVDSVDDISHPVIRECLKLYNWTDTLNIATMSDIPGGTGLGSSSAFTVGFINLLHSMRGETVTKYELSRQAIHLEREVLKENVGVQDQIHAAFGGLSRYELEPQNISISPLRMSSSRMKLLNNSMFLVYTGNQRSASEVLNTQEARTKSGSNADYLKEMYEMTRTGAAILEDTGDDVAALTRFGDLMDQGWHLKRQLSSKISDRNIDNIYLSGRIAGAWGGKLLGAGGGGFVLFMAPAELRSEFEKQFGVDNVVPVSMESAGSTVTKVI